MSRAVILNPPAKVPARGLVVADRIPRMGARTGAGVFDATGDVVYDCDTLVDGKPCGWGCAGPRAHVREAVAAHNRMFHTLADGPILGMLNDRGRHA